MAVDMKRVIAEATRTLLMDKHVKKLTVKDIVEECHITRQTFYYHFEDIPDLLRWILEQGMEQSMREIRRQDGPEAGLRYFFLMSLNARPYFQKSMASNYGAELESLIKEEGCRLFAQLVEERGLYRDCGPYERDLILRYHSQAVLAILKDWTDEDSQNLDRAVHTVHLLLTGGVKPFSEGSGCSPESQMP